MHNLSERHADIESVAFDVRSSRDGDACCAVVEEIRIGGVAECHTDEEVLVAPGVVVVTAGIETGGDVTYSRVKNHRTSASSI